MAEKKFVDWIHMRSVVDYMPSKYELIYAGFDITEKKKPNYFPQNEYKEFSKVW